MIMYDTIVLKLLKEDIGDKYNWEAVYGSIYQISAYKQINGGSGNLDGLRVKVTEKYVKVSGSLSKYFTGSNLRTLSLCEIAKAIWDIGKSLGVPMYKANVVQVDIAENFEMSYPPEFYISKMQSWGDSHPNDWKGTTYFPSNNVMLRFYDKSKEVRQKRKKNSPTEISKNLLRYEISFGTKKIRQMFGRQLKAKDLYDKTVFWEFISEWLCSYDEIGIIPDKILDVNFEQIKTQSDFEDWCICVAHSSIRLPAFVKGRFKVRERNGNKTDIQDRQYHKRIQDKIRKAIKNFSYVMGQPDLIKELVDKIETYLTEKFENSHDAFDIQEECQEDAVSVK